MTKKYLLPFGCIFSLLTSSVVSQPFPTLMQTLSYSDSTLPNLSRDLSYGFKWPVNSSILSMTPSSYIPSVSPVSGNGRYLISLYGPRFKKVTSSNVGFYDFHAGEDFTADVEYGGTFYSATTKYSEVCGCDGVVHAMVTTDPGDESGITVTIKCDSSFKTSTNGIPDNWGNVYWNHNHLSSINSKLLTGGVGYRVAKGDTVGVIGESGTTTLVHLHLNVKRMISTSLRHVHPMRVMDTANVINDYTHIVKGLKTVRYEWLADWGDSALFRIAIPFNQMVVKRFRVYVPTTGYDKLFDYEDILRDHYGTRDQNNIVTDLSVFAYPMNKGESAYARYFKEYQTASGDTMPASYPASSKRSPSSGNFPIPNAAPFNSKTPILYVMDIIARNLPANHSNITIEFSDIYGNVVRGFIPHDESLPVQLTAFTAERKSENIFLKWITASEVNNAMWLIQRRAVTAEEDNGTEIQETFETINQISGHGSTSELSSYAYVDSNADKFHHYQYRLANIALDGEVAYSNILDVNADPAKSVLLYQNYPNPFNPETKIYFELPFKEFVTLQIFDVTGRKVFDLVSQNMDAGFHSVGFNGQSLAGGIYFYKLTAGRYSETRKMILLK